MGTGSASRRTRWFSMAGPSRPRILRNVEVSEGHAQGARYGEHAAVVAGKLNGLPLAPEELE